MKKVLLAFDGTQFSEGAFEFARRLNRIQPILLTGVFIPQVTYANLWSYATGIAGAVYTPFLEEEDVELIQKNVERFAWLCEENGISYKVHKDYYDLALPEIIKETRFADLMLISSEKFFENLVGANPERFMQDALHESECPVIVVPEHFQFPDKNIIAYDGSDSSVYAIKQFAYLFPELCVNNTILVFLNDDESSEIPNEKYIMELAMEHFKNLKLVKLELDPKRYFNTWTRENPGAILISGSFGRSSLSLLFKKSFVSKIIAEHKLPVFVAHR